MNKQIKKNHKSSIINHQSGFTLIELAIYMGILSILLFVLTNFFITALDTQLESQATSSVDQDSKFILNRLSYDITNADNVTIPLNPGDQTNSLQLVKNGITYTYSLNGTSLTITDNVGTDVLNSIGTTISNLSFQKIGYAGEKPTVQIKFTINSVAVKKGGNDSESFQTTMGLR